MNPLLIPLIGPVIEGAIDLIKRKPEAKENLTSTTSKIGYGVATAATSIMVNTDLSVEQLVTGLVGYAVSLCLVLYKERKRGSGSD